MKEPSEHPLKSRLHPSGWFYWPLALLAGLMLRLVFLLHVHVDPAVRKVKGPVILIGNHPSYLDPAIMATAMLPRKIRFVTSRDFFRSRTTRFILNMLGAIPKMQFRTDTQAIKSILLTIRSGGAVAIYPEGQRSLDGRLQPIDTSMAKLIKKAACTVILVMEQGAYLAWPRWSPKGIRAGRIDVHVGCLFTADQIKHLTVESIQRRIVQAMDYNDYNQQKRTRYRYRTRSPAKGIDLICHQCPACGRELAMRSDRNTLTCRFCGNQGRVALTGLIEPVMDSTVHKSTKDRIWPDVASWHRWQIGQLKKQMADPSFSRRYTAVLSWPDEPENDQAITGVLEMTVRHLSFFEGRDDALMQQPFLRIPVENRSGISASFGHYFDLAYNDRVYRFTPDPGHAVIILADIIRAHEG
ncbi:MAG: lysophospholipid acyltransferase family protein [Bacillota bacterium]|nr:lysophospholipid acyltransferase family protein [Bacillota bacterium]